MSMYFNRRSASLNRKKAMSDINVTPMVDVMLVLLVIFMVTAPLLTSGINIDLPKGDGKVMQSSDKSLDISINHKGKIFIGNKEYKQSEVIPKITSIAENNPEIRIIISGDKKASYGQIIEVMAMIKAAGFSKVGLKTDPKEVVKK